MHCKLEEMIKFDFSRAQQSAAVAITAAWEKISVTSNGNVPYDIIMTRPTRRDYKRRVRQDFFLPRVGSCTSELQLKVNSRLKVNWRKKFGLACQLLARRATPNFYLTIHFCFTIHFQLQFTCTWSGPICIHIALNYEFHTKFICKPSPKILFSILVKYR